MAANPAPAYRAAYDAKIPFRLSVVKSESRMDATIRPSDIDEALGAARGILFGLLLCAPFWVGLFVVLF
jgi:hypothetical protein